MPLNSVSVIIPMYNVEKYAAECIESVINQTHRNLEIILVNDGSTDSTPEICRKYAEKDNRITVIDKENGGPTSCRAEGRKLAKGEYIFFSDSDDILCPELIEKLLCACVENNAEISACGYEKFGCEQRVFPVKCKSVVIEKDEFETEIVLPAISATAKDTTDIPTYYWNHLYRADCLTDDCFVSDRVCTREDIYTNLKVLDNVNRIAVVDEILYRYRISVNSLTVAYRENRFEKDLYFIGFVRDFMREKNISCDDRLKKMISGTAYGCIDNFCKSGSYDIFKDGIKKMYSVPEINEAVSTSLNGSISKAQKITGALYLKKQLLILYVFRKLIFKLKGIS